MNRFQCNCRNTASLIDIFKIQNSQASIFIQGLEENLRETQATAQRLETHLKQKEKLYEDKIKVTFKNSLLLLDKNKFPTFSFASGSLQLLNHQLSGYLN